MKRTQSSRRRSVGRHIALLARRSQVFLALRFQVFGIGSGQFPLLAELYHEEGLSQEELTERVKIDKANVARGTARLEKAGYVVRTKDKNDGRVNRLFLTARAREIYDDFFAAAENLNAILLKDFTKHEQALLLDMLQRMAENADNASF